MTGCGCLTVVLAGFVALAGTCTAAEQKRQEERERAIAIRQEQERRAEYQRRERRRNDSIRAETERRQRETRIALRARNARAMEWVRSVNSELVDRVATVRQQSRDFDALIARVQALKTENPDRLELLRGYEARYVGVRDSLNAVASRIESQLVDAYVHYRILDDLNGESFPELSGRLMREAEDVLAVASEIRRSTEAKTLEANHGPQ